MRGKNGQLGGDEKSESFQGWGYQGREGSAFKRGLVQWGDADRTQRQSVGSELRGRKRWLGICFLSPEWLRAVMAFHSPQSLCLCHKGCKRGGLLEM